LANAASQAVDAGMNLPEVSTDIEGNPRPSGTNYDIGAFEYQMPTALADILEKSNISFHPNPFKAEIFLSHNELHELSFSLVSTLGKEVFRGKVIDNKILVGNQPNGTYILTIRDKRGGIVHSGMVVKL